MTEFIPNVPCKYQYLLKDNKTQFILLHKLIDNQEYLNYYLNNKFEYILLDNSAFELGESMDGNLLMQYAKKLKVNEIIIPDVYRDKDKTLQLTNEFIEKNWMECQINNIKMMGVPQGKDENELFNCLIEMLYNTHIKVIGLNKLWKRDYKTLQSIIYLCLKANKEVHFLGTKNLLDWGLIKSLDGVRSADSRILTKLVSGVDNMWEITLSYEEIAILGNFIKEINGKNDYII